MSFPTHQLPTTARFRAAPAYELVPFDRLSGEDQALFAELQAEPGFFGLLRPRDARGGALKSVDRDTALLLYALAEPGPLPFFVRREPGAVESAATLLMDGVLEIEREGRFVSGAEVTELLAAQPHAASEHPLARLSAEALRFAAAASELGAAHLGGELYNFNRRPISPRWAALLTDREAVLDFVGLSRGSAARHAVRRSWVIDSRDEAPGWIYFSQREGAARNGTMTFKLYVSPAVEDLGPALAAVLQVAARHGVASLKLGTDAAGLLRADKLVLYFADLESLLAVARDLEPALDGIAAQGVPFTAPIDRRGLLSWGADPPPSARPLSWQGRESWRSWLARRLAVALVAASSEDPEVAARFALERMRREGLDVERWVPTAGLWKAA